MISLVWQSGPNKPRCLCPAQKIFPTPALTKNRLHEQGNKESCKYLIWILKPLAHFNRVTTLLGPISFSFRLDHMANLQGQL